MGIKYHIKGIGKNKAIKKERGKPLPLALMKYEIIATSRPILMKIDLSKHKMVQVKTI